MKIAPLLIKKNKIKEIVTCTLKRNNVITYTQQGEGQKLQTLL